MDNSKSMILRHALPEMKTGQLVQHPNYGVCFVSLVEEYGVILRIKATKKFPGRRTGNWSVIVYEGYKLNLEQIKRLA